MKLTKEQLKKIIKEEISGVINEYDDNSHLPGYMGQTPMGQGSTEEGANPEEVFGSTAGLSQGPTTDLASELERELVPLWSQGADREEMIIYLSELQIDLGGVLPEDAVDWWLERNRS